MKKILQEIVLDQSRSKSERQLAAKGLSDIPSDNVQQFLSELGKTHIRETTESELLAYVDAHDLKHQFPLIFDQLRQEFCFWNLPSANLLEILGLSEAQYWQVVLELTNSHSAKIHANERLRACVKENHDNQ
jgi:hypothetical protein